MPASTSPTPAGVPAPWWRDGVVYQIYPRSFLDTNGDGIGDLRGVIRQLDYLNDGTEQSLGVDAIWLSPVYPSPMYDFGYDVSDYTAISPEFGTMEDFQELVREAHLRGIRVILDLVMNHCSTAHPWFAEARASRQSEKRDWFIWHDGKPGGRPRPPNNWLATFGGRAWAWEPGTQQFYLHSFLAEQPDVNWRNPALKQAMKDMMRFWLDLGVDGFRLDVVNWFLKDRALRDNPRKIGGLRPYDRQQHLFDRNQPETLELTREIRALVDSYPDRMTVGEVFVEPPGDPALPAQYYAHGEGLHMAFNFAFLYCKWGAEHFSGAVARWEGLLGPELWPNYTLSNHDQPRAYARYDRRGQGDARARVAAAMLLTLRGTPFLYYGEEIGMRGRKIPRARLQDPLGKRYWPFHPGRDPARTPMQWSAEAGAGFSAAEPWLPLCEDHRTVNVDLQKNDPASLLSWYRKLVHLRKRTPALRGGAYDRLAATSPGVFGFIRSLGEARILVLLNFEAEQGSAVLPDGGARAVLLSSHSRATPKASGPTPLAPHEVLIAQLA
jgi:alpha-glucosidase